MNAAASVAATARPRLSDNAYAQILMNVGFRGRAMLGFLVIGAALILSLVGLWRGWDMIKTFAPPVVSIALTAGWWVCFFGLQGQNHPNAARLVPGQLRQLREVAVVLFLVPVLMCGLLLAWAGLQGPAWTIAVAFAFAALALFTRFPWLWVAVWVVPTTAAIWVPSDARLWLWSEMRHAYAQQPLTLAALTLLGLSALIWILFQDGGAAHERHWHRAQRLNRVMRGQVIDGSAQTAYGNRVGTAFCWLRTRWQEHLLRVAEPTARSTVARAEMVANANAHWSLVVGSAVLILAGLGLVAGVFWLFYPAEGPKMLRGSAQGFCFGIVGMLVNPALTPANALYKRRREQSLLMLLPGLPRGEALNRRLARRQLVQFLACWLLALVLVMFLQRVAGSGPSGEGDGPLSSLSGWALNFAALVLPASLWMWRDWSRQGEPNGTFAALRMMVLIGGMSLMGFLMAWQHLSPWTIMGASVALTAALALWRWRIVTRSPSFWPVGRWS